MNTQDRVSLNKYLSPAAVLALAFGACVGWGAFVMPGNTFLPIGGPLGTLLGLFIGSLIMTVIAYNYTYLMKKYPDSGGAYTYAGEMLGKDRGFLCAWLLILTYCSVIWANVMAFSFITRYLFGDTFRFGHLYSIAGYDVCLGEILLSLGILAVCAFICLAGRKILVYSQTFFAGLLFFGILIAFVAVVIKKGGFSGLSFDFTLGKNRVMQTVGIMMLSPWAFIGFESVSHSTEEFSFDKKKIYKVLVLSIVLGFASYAMLALIAPAIQPEGFSDWHDYIRNLSEESADRLGGQYDLRRLPTFFASREALGGAGVWSLALAALGGVATGIIANLVAVSRLICRMADDGAFPEKLGKVGKKSGAPFAAILFVCAFTAFIPLFGRTAIVWIVDVTTIGATVVYAYVSVSCFRAGRKENKKKAVVCGLLGTLISLAFTVYYMFPNQSGFASESYLILIIWSMLGLFIFRLVLAKDRKRKFGKSEAVWIVLLMLILLVSLVWIRQITLDNENELNHKFREYYEEKVEKTDSENDKLILKEEEEYFEERVFSFGSSMVNHTSILMLMLFITLMLILSVYSGIKKREELIEAERIQAEESSKAKSIFLSNMSHDLRTPMNAVTGYTALALKEKDPEKVADYLNKIDFSSRHLLSLINDILDMSRIESGKTELENAPADVVAMFDGVYDIFYPQAQEKPLELTKEIVGVRDRYAVCDINRLNRIMLNLLSNAIKFTPAGGKVSFSLKELGKTGGRADYEIRVKDNGIGMSREFAKSVFEAFERERTRTVSKIQGTGLGMAITKGLVDLMGGEIRVETEQGKGTEFIINLSFDTVAELPAKDSGENEKIDFTGMKLVLAEDNPINTEIAETVLSHAGFEVTCAENGKVAVDIVASSKPGEYKAVLMDIQMPVMSGLDAARAIRALRGEQRNIPIIAVSANVFAEDIRDSKAAGMNAHIGKPIDVNEMMRTLENIIKESSDK